MKALFVDACIRENSRTRTLCKAYMQANWNGEGTDLKILELLKEPLVPLDKERLLQRDRDLAKGNLASPSYRYAREFAQADEILIGAPYWDCSFPALLKIWLEQICVNGIAFRYGQDGRPVKCCACQKLIVVTTAGGYLPANNSLERYWEEMCGLFSIPKLRVIKAEGLDIQGNDPQAILQRAIEEIRER